MKSWKKTKKYLIIRLWTGYGLTIVVAIAMPGTGLASWSVSMYLSLFSIIVLSSLINILDEITPFIQDGSDVEADSIPNRNAGDRG